MVFGYGILAFGILPKMVGTKFSIFINFLIQMHVLMLYINFELIRIKFGFFMNF